MQRQPHAFLLTVLLDDDQANPLRGRIRFVATGVEVTFACVDEMLAFIRDRVEEAESKPPTLESGDCSGCRRL